MQVLLLVPHVLAADRHAPVRAGERPQADYDALAEAVQAAPGGRADILDRGAVTREGGWLVRLTLRLLGINWALAMLGFLRCGRYDVVFSHSEIVALPLSMLFLLRLGRRPRHVTTAYYLHGRRNAVWYRVLRAHARIDTIFVLSRMQHEIGARLGLPPSRLVYLDSRGFVDTGFFAATPPQPETPRQICAVGREFRDYGSLIKAMTGLPDVTLKLDPASPWSMHQACLGNQVPPANVELCRLEFGTVRHLYAESIAIVIPLLPNPIGAGSTTLIEAMAMGKPVIVTRTKGDGFSGRPELVDGENILLVDPGDVEGLRQAIARLADDPALRARIGAAARRWAELYAGRADWLAAMLGAFAGTATAAAPASAQGAAKPREAGGGVPPRRADIATSALRQ